VPAWLHGWGAHTPPLSQLQVPALHEATLLGCRVPEHRDAAVHNMHLSHDTCRLTVPWHMPTYGAAALSTSRCHVAV